MKFSGVRSIIKNSSYLVTGQVCNIVLRGILIIILARLLEPEAYGQFNYGIAWYLALITLTYLGLDIVLGKEAGKGKDAVSALLGPTLKLRAGVSVGISAISIALATMLEPDGATRQLIYIFSLAMIARAIWLWCVSVFTAFEDTRQSFLIDITFRPIEVIVLIVLATWLAKNNVLALATGHAILWGTQAVVGLFAVRKYQTAGNTSFDFLQLKSLLAIGAPYAPYTIVLGCFMQLPIVLFRLFLGLDENLGQFALAYQSLGYLIAIPIVMATTTLPILARSVARGDDKDLKIILGLVFIIPILGVVVGLLGTTIITPVVVLVFGESYQFASQILSDVIWLLIPFTLAVSLQQFIFTRWPGLLGSLSGLAGVVLMIILFPPLTREFSHQGAILATAIGLSAWATGLLVVLIKNGALSKK